MADTYYCTLKMQTRVNLKLNDIALIKRLTTPLDTFRALSLGMVFCCSIIVCSGMVAANESALECRGENVDCRKVGSWEISLAVGLGGRSNPLAGGDDQPIFLVPQFSWYGEKFFLENLEFGYTFVDRPNHMLNAIITPGFDHTFFEDFGLGNFTIDSYVGSRSEGFSNAFVANGAPPAVAGELPDTDDQETLGNEGQRVDLDDLDDRKMAVFGGLEYNYFRGKWQTNLQALSDISGVHDGSEIRLSVARYFQRGENLYTLAAGLAWQSEALLDYYYGVDAGELSPAHPGFEVDAGISSFVKISWQKKLSEKWSFLSALHYRKMDSSLVASPLVETDGIATAFTGVSYHF